MDGEKDKIWWNNVYRNWDEVSIQGKALISEDTFGYIPNIICQFIQKTLTDLIQLPVEPEWQLALTI